MGHGEGIPGKGKDMGEDTEGFGAGLIFLIFPKNNLASAWRMEENVEVGRGPLL